MYHINMYITLKYNIIEYLNGQGSMLYLWPDQRY